MTPPRSSYDWVDVLCFIGIIAYIAVVSVAVLVLIGAVL